MTMLPTPPAGPPGAVAAWVAEHLGGLYADGPVPSARFRGGQPAADAALAAFDVAGYASRRSAVRPEPGRGASGLGPYVRHGLLQLPALSEAVAGGPVRDVAKFRDELLWQEYARHLYARLGSLLGEHLRAEPPPPQGSSPERAWDRTMACVDLTVSELENDGYLVNQTRLWLASQWSVRHGLDWREGADRFYRHLLCGSPAANNLGWQWAAGTATGKPYGFSRWQVEKRAPGLCATCRYERSCPIQEWPPERPTRWRTPPELLVSDPDPEATAGPREAEVDEDPQAVWLTAESLGDDDPALSAWPDRPGVFAFDEAVLARLQLSGKRLVFLAEILGSLAERRELEVHRGDPVAVLTGRPVAATFTPVPGWRRRSRRARLAAVHPWPWLRRPSGGTLASFSAWSNARGARRPGFSGTPRGSRRT